MIFPRFKLTSVENSTMTGFVGGAINTTKIILVSKKPYRIHEALERRGFVVQEWKLEISTSARVRKVFGTKPLKTDYNFLLEIKVLQKPNTSWRSLLRALDDCNYGLWLR